MSAAARNHRIYRFGVFEFDSSTLELRRDGKTEPRLREQALQVLLALLDRPKQIVTREELQERLWPSDTFVDFEHGLNTAINQVRNALGDSAGSPRFIQTLPRRGYRFIAPIEMPGGAGAEQISQTTSRAGLAEEPVGLSKDVPSDQLSTVPYNREETVPRLPSTSVLSDPSELPNASMGVVRLLFSLIQLLYLSMYVVSLARLSRLEVILTESQDHASFILTTLIITAAVGIPIRLYLLTAAAFKYHGLNDKFQKLFVFLFPLDELWALAPFLMVNQVGFGLAIAMTATLLYLPFSQRSLLLMGFSAKNKPE